MIVDPRPEVFGSGYDETSIDLHLDSIEKGARVWDIEAYKAVVQNRQATRHAEIELGSFDWKGVANEYLIEVPNEPPGSTDLLVFCRSRDIIVRPFGFLLWSTKEKIGTPKIDPEINTPQPHPELICFVNAKSTKARTGLLVHFTAPTIHAGWSGNVTLEITNLGPFDFVIREDDVIAQLTVGMISSAPDLSLRRSRQQTHGQLSPLDAAITNRPSPT